jgi:DNA-binding MarR family transcriptional regulator
MPKKEKPPARAYEQAATLREALRSFSRHSEEVTRGHGLTARTYQLLLMIKTSRNGDECAAPSELEERLQLGKSTVTELVLRSEQRGLVRRQLAPRRRGIIVRLTPKGERALATSLTELGDERARLIKLLSKLSDGR